MKAESGKQTKPILVGGEQRGGRAQWLETSGQWSSAATVLGRSRAASPTRSNHNRPVDALTAILSGPVAEPNNSKTLAAHRNDAPQWSTSDMNRCTTPTAYC